MRTFTILCAIILVIVFTVWRGGDDREAEPQNAAAEPVVPVQAAEAPGDDLVLQAAVPTSRYRAPSRGGEAVDEPADQATVTTSSHLPGIRIHRELATAWAGEADKESRRVRHRIVESGFKYPHLVLEEAVRRDPATGGEVATLIQASVASHLLVGFHRGVSEDDGIAALEGEGFDVLGVEPGSFVIVEVPGFSGLRARAAAIARLQAMADVVAFAEPDYLTWPSLVPNDPSWSLGRMWGLHNPGTAPGYREDADIDAPEGWEIRSSAGEVVVAITDTGVRYTHEDLVSNMWVNPGEVAGDGIDNDGNGVIDDIHGFDAANDDGDPFDENGHGTHTAGTVGARGGNALGVTGVAWEVKLMAGQNLSAEGPGATSDGVRVVNYARRNGADIISASWGGGSYSMALDNALKQCADEGVLFVTAAGNSARDNDATPFYPASYGHWNVVSVAASNGNDELARFSSWGRNSVDLAAPGVNIWSTYISSDSSYHTSRGTSMATPHVSGVLALMKAQFPSASGAELLLRLYDSVDPAPDLAGKVRTGGRLNLARALGSTYDGPPNDDLAAAMAMEGTNWQWSGVNEDATREPGEDAFSPGTGNRSLWFAWRAPVAGLVELTARADDEAVLTAYRGNSPGNLSRLRSARGRGEEVTVRFYAEAGADHRFSLDSGAAGEQAMALALRLLPANDNFADAAVVSGELFSVRGDNFGATGQPFERSKPHGEAGAGKSVWYRWVAPISGDYVVTTAGSSFDTVLAVYTLDGSDPSNLSEVGSNDDRSATDWTSQVSFAATEGTTYHIAVDSYAANSAGEFVLSGLREGQLAIVDQPDDLRVPLGGRAEFRVGAVAGRVPLEFQWFRDGEPLPGKTEERLLLDPVRPIDVGSYHVSVRSPSDVLVSESAMLVEERRAPTIVWSSGPQAVLEGAGLEMGVQARGSEPLAYAWFKDGIAVPEWTEASVALSNVTAQAAGVYRVEVSNDLGSAEAEFQVRVVMSPFEAIGAHYGTGFGPIQEIVYDDARDRWLALVGDEILASDDGQRWSRHTLPGGMLANHLAATSNGVFVVGQLPGSFPEVFRIARSVDLESWQWLSPNRDIGGLRALTSLGDRLIGVFGSFSFQTASSTDGTTWTDASATLPGGEAAPVYGRPETLSVANGVVFSAFRDELFYSRDGLVWEHRLLPDGANMLDVAFWNGLYYFFDQWTLLTSPDLENWMDGGTKAMEGAGWSGVLGEDLVKLSEGSLFTQRCGPSTGNVVVETVIDPGLGHAFNAAHFSERGLMIGTSFGHLQLVQDLEELRFPDEPAVRFTRVEYHDGHWLAMGVHDPDGGATQGSDEHIRLRSADGRRWERDILGPAYNSFIGQYGKYWWAYAPANASARRGSSLLALDEHQIVDPEGGRRDLRKMASHGDEVLGLFEPAGFPSNSVYPAFSTDGGDSWTFPDGAPAGNDTWSWIGYLNGRWFLTNAQEDENTAPSYTWVSHDGLTWEAAQYLDTDGSPYSTETPTRIVFHEGMYYMADWESFGGLSLLRSTDGLRWLRTAGSGLPEADRIRDLQVMGGYLVVMMETLDSRMLVAFSRDGQTWFDAGLPADTIGMSSDGAEGVFATESSGILHLPASYRSEVLFTETWNSGAADQPGRNADWSEHMGRGFRSPSISGGDLLEGDLAYQLPAGGHAFFNLTEQDGIGFAPNTRYRIMLRVGRTTVTAGNRLDFGLWSGVPADPVPGTAVNEAAGTTASLGSGGRVSATALPANSMLEFPFINDGGKHEFVFETGDAPPSGDLVIFLRNASTNGGTIFLDYVRLVAETRAVNSANAAPIVAFENLGNPSSILRNSTLQVTVQAEDPDGEVDRVAFYFDGELLGEDREAPYTQLVRFEDLGTFTLSARAFDAEGRSASVASAIEVAGRAYVDVLDPVDQPAFLESRSWSGAPAEGHDLLAVYEDHLWRSEDGISWSKLALPVLGAIYDIVPGGGSFLLRHENDFFATRDGINWTRTLSLEEGRNVTVEFLGGKWVVRDRERAGERTDYMLISEDGFDWVSTIPSETLQAIPDAVPSGDHSVWVGLHSRRGMSYSLDGGNYWTAVAGEAPSQVSSKIIWHAGRFHLSDGTARLWSSEDGRTWEARTVGAAAIRDFYLVGPQLFIRADDEFMVSADGLSWTRCEAPGLRLSDMVWGESGYMTFSTARDGWVRFSPDGITWVESGDGLPSGFEARTMTAFGANFYLTGRYQAGYLWDGATGWIPVRPRIEPTSGPEPTIFGGRAGRYVALGEDYWAFSPDHGQTWERIDPPVDGTETARGNPWGVEYRDGKFVALLSGTSRRGTLWSSADGENWSLDRHLPDVPMQSVYWGSDDLFMVSDDEGMFRIPFVGTGWEELPAIPGVVNVRYLCIFGDTTFAIGDRDDQNIDPSRWYTLENGSDWTDRGQFPISADVSDEYAAVEGFGKLVVYLSDYYGSPLAMTEDGQNWTNLPGGQFETRDLTLTTVPSGFLAYERRGELAWRAGPDAQNWVAVSSYARGQEWIRTIDGTVGVVADGKLFLIPSLDLALEFESEPEPADRRVEDVILLDLVLRNLGEQESGVDEWIVETWFSSDALVGDHDDQLLSTVPLAAAPPSPGEAVSFQQEVRIPSDIEAGDFRIFAKLRHVSGAPEINENNNVAVTAQEVVHIALRRLDVEVDGDGSVGVENLREFYPDGAVVNLFAQSSKGSVFSGWSGDAQGTLNETSITMDADRTVVAGFAPVAHLNVRVVGNGSVVGSESAGIYDVGTTAGLEAIPSPGWTFLGWSGDLSGSAPSESLLMDRNRNVTAQFGLPFANWKAQHFSAAELDQPAVSGDEVDLDGDGFVLWQEYVGAGDPRNAASPPPADWQAGAGWLALTFTRLSNPEAGFGLTAEASGTLADWETMGVEERILATDAGVETVEARIPIQAGGTGFLRLLYVRP